MLKDITNALKPVVDKIVIISKDEDVLSYARELELETIVENDNSNLNKALKQAMKWCRTKTRKVVILPSDIPLIGKTNIELLIKQSKKLDFIIVPSKGGGTNTIIMKPLAIDMKFEGFSFEKHVNEAYKKNLNPMVHDSFFMALDVNTPEDLGEIMLHGNGTETKTYHWASLWSQCTAMKDLRSLGKEYYDRAYNSWLRPIWRSWNTGRC